jgi:hypothetical protein
MARTEKQVLLNEPITITLAPVGARKKPIKVVMTAPCQDAEAEYFALISVTMNDFAKGNLPFIVGALQGKSVEKIPFNAPDLLGMFRSVIAKIIADGTSIEGVNPAWVGKNTNTAQQAQLLQAFGELIGWKVLKATFWMAIKGWQTLTPKSESDAGPSWSRNASSKSPARSPS